MRGEFPSAAYDAWKTTEPDYGRGRDEPGPSRRDLKKTLFAAVRLFGADDVRDVLEEVIDDTK